MRSLAPFLFCMIFFMFSNSAFAQYRCNFEGVLPQGAVSYPIGSFACANANISGIQALAHVLDCQTSSEAYFSAPISALDLNKYDVNWQFRVRHAYAPSQSNNWLVYLSAEELSIANGFAIGVNASSTDDLLQIYAVTNGKFTSILKTSFNWEQKVGISAAPLISINRKLNGDWTLSVSVDGDPSKLEILATGNSTFANLLKYWGVRYKFTKTQDLKLWIDDVAIDYTLVESPIPEPVSVKAHDVIISEIMPDPEPVVGLPAYEYVEIQNVSKHELSLANWTLSVGNKVFQFPLLLLKADSLLIISTGEGAIALNQYGKTLGLFSSKTTMNNEGATLVLRDNTGKIIDAAMYSSADLQQSAGGRSIISKRVQNSCLIENYWQLSENEKGGTPGFSAVDTKNSAETLSIVNSYIASDTTIHLVFNQSVDSTLAIDPTRYQLSDNTLQISTLSVVPPFFDEVVINVKQPIKSGNVLTVNVLNGYCNCDSVATTSVLSTEVAIPEAIKEGDVIFSEIRFEPLAGYPEFIELQNVSNKAIDVGTLELRITSASGKTYKSRFSSSQLLFPNQIVAYFSVYDTTKCAWNKQCRYWTAMPNLTSGEGLIELCDTAGTVLENMLYNQNWQFVLLNEKRGHSLERISSTLPAYDSNSWQTSAMDCGTPGFENSQQLIENKEQVTISLSTETFGLTPGLEKEVSICLHNLPVGGMLSMQIFDISGNHRCWLARNALAGNEYCMNWNGKNDSNQLENNGIYIVFARWVYPGGTVREWKKAVVWVKQ